MGEKLICLGLCKSYQHMTKKPAAGKGNGVKQSQAVTKRHNHTTVYFDVKTSKPTRRRRKTKI
jgi:hypothetical protein